MGRYSGEVAAVVGASRGIGRAVAERLAARGARVLLIARDERALAELAGELPGTGHRAVAADVADPRAGMRLAREVQEWSGRLDILVYSAGVLPLGPALTLEEEVAREAMEVNFWGAVRTVRSLWPAMRMGGRKSVILISSLATHMVLPFFFAYAGSKMALRAFAGALRQEWAAEGFHVGVVSPGPVNTGMVEGKLHTPLYRIPRWMPVLEAREVARAVDRAIYRRRKETVVPGWLAPLARLGAARPAWVETAYRWMVPDARRDVPDLVTSCSQFNQNHSEFERN
ncbi:MAG: SDR family oxidoreductase [Alicyclobacillaceae bacterium]|nr:SDR family oxidoreductase [Alicyclobacillaceae bacterium]